jgi:tripartite-type tricarboxylate transporter receptor subunit TctC
LRALATTANSRIPALPDLPTVAETYNGFEVDFWWGLFAPAQTPQATLKRLAEWFTEAMGTSDLAARLTGLGFYPSATCGAPFAELLRQQFDDYGRVIRDANVRPE